jgi:aminotransferase
MIAQKTRERIASRVRAVPPSGIRRFFDIAATMPDVISLGVGEPDFITPAQIRAAGQRSIDTTTAYTSNAGLLELRQAVAEHLQWLYGIAYDPETEILITVGVSEAMQLATLALFEPDEEVLVPEPCFVAYPATVMFTDAHPVYVPTSVEQDFQVSAADLEAALTPQTRGLIIGYPNNPTGAVISRKRMLELAAVAEEHDLMVLSDEIYDRLVYGVEHVCFAALPGMRDRTVTLGGFSKAYAMTGWRLGWLAAPADITAAARKVHQYAIMSAPTMSQYAGLAALKSGEGNIAEMLSEYDRRRQVVVAGLNRIGLPTFEPHGAFYAFPRIDRFGLSSEAFAEQLLMEEQVAVIPGDAFGPSGAGFVRICYATSMEKIEQALDRIERFVQRR